jgi:hypothetical protein
MKNRTFLISIPFVTASLLVLVLMIAIGQPASAQNPCPSPSTSTSAPGVPTNLRVDIADASTGKLFISWNPPTGSTGTLYYTLCRSTSQNSGYLAVNYCSQGAYQPSSSNPQYDIDAPGTAGTLACRDDGGVLAYPNNAQYPPLTSGTPYYYEIQACNGTGSVGNSAILCGAFTSSVNPPPYNTPVSCSTCSFPTLQGALNTKTHLITIASPANNTIETSKVTPNAMFQATANEDYAYHNTGTTGTPAEPIPYQNKLVVNLPGSGSLCGGGELMWVARNLGFDTICVNYDNASEQENVCSPVTDSSLNTATAVAECFTAISQAKFNYQAATFPGTPSTIDCTLAGAPNPLCGYDKTHNGQEGKTGNYYYVATLYDSVEYRIATMLHYLWCNTSNTYGTYWQAYLLDNLQPIANTTTCAPLTPYTTAFTPNWPSIILGGWSQGGDMATFAYYYLASLAPSENVNRVINLSAPPSAVAFGGTMVPAGYFNTAPYGPLTNGFRNIYGFVSANDLTHYCADVGGVAGLASVYQTVWNAMGFNSANDDAELDLNFSVNNYAYSANYQYPDSDLTGEICTKWNERESTWRKSGACRSRGTSQSRS